MRKKYYFIMAVDGSKRVPIKGENNTIMLFSNYKIAEEERLTIAKQISALAKLNIRQLEALQTFIKESEDWTWDNDSMSLEVKSENRDVVEGAYTIYKYGNLCTKSKTRENQRKSILKLIRLILKEANDVVDVDATLFKYEITPAEIYR